MGRGGAGVNKKKENWEQEGEGKGGGGRVRKVYSIFCKFLQWNIFVICFFYVEQKLDLLADIFIM